VRTPTSGLPRFIPAVIAVICLLLSPLPAHAQSWQFPLGEETTPDEFDLVFTLKAPSPWPAAARLQVALCMRDESHFYYADFSGGKVSLGYSASGKRFALSRPVALGKAETYEVCIQRHASLLQLVCDGRRLATAYHDRLRGGKVAITASGEVAVDELTAQPIGEIHFDDDYTRSPDDAGEWELLSGEWKGSGESIERPKPELSANPFSYHVHAEGKALAVTGYDFWSGYRLRAAVKPAAEGAVGLAFYLTNPDNYYLLRWSHVGAAEGPAGGRLQLVKVQAGSWSVLAEEVDFPYRIDQWYDLTVTVADGQLEAYVDGRSHLAARDNTFVRGRIALFAEDCDSAYFDDVQVRGYDCFSEDFSSADVTKGRCQPRRGRWQVKRQHLYGAGQASSGQAYLLAGDPTWSDYVVNAKVKLKNAQRVGIVFCYDGPANHYLLRWGRTQDGQGLRELVRVADGKEEVLATAHFSPNPVRFEDIRVVSHRGHIALSTDGRLALEAADTAFTRGQVGLYVEGDQQACFDNLTVRFPQAPPLPPPITKQFTKEETMVNWASPQASWVKLKDGAFRYSLPIFTDFRADVHLKKLTEEKGKLELFIGADDQLKGGARLTASAEGGMLKAELSVGDALVASGEAHSDSAAPTLVVERQGDTVLASLEDPGGESLLLAQQAGGAVGGKYVGFKRGGLSPTAGRIQVRSRGILDHTFSGAPTGWQSGKGLWEVYDRWPCFRGWSWFGGRDESGDPKNPTLWCKDTWAGEMVLQVWSGLIMDLDHEPGYSDPSDLNVTICADGKNLCSGYSFIYAGDHNKRAKILRKDTVVAETDKGVFINPISPNPKFHRHWFETRIHKVGGHIEYYVDDKLLLSYDDPDPLPGGSVAIWSYNNGILISRVRITAEQRVRGG